MKVEAKKEQETFKPIELKISLETIDEVAAFYAIFNYNPLVEITSEYGIDDDAIRGSITRALGQIPLYNNPFNAIKERMVEVKF